MIDFYLRFRPQTSERTRLALSRSATIVWGIVLFTLALASRYGGSVLERGLSIASVAYGGLLGVFLLGLLTKRATQTGAIVGMICGLALNVYIWEWTHVAWTWYVTIGSSTTFIVGYVASLATAPQPRQEETRASTG
jgi:Na+/proline symporter